MRSSTATAISAPLFGAIRVSASTAAGLLAAAILLLLASLAVALVRAAPADVVNGLTQPEAASARTS